MNRFAWAALPILTIALSSACGDDTDGDTSTTGDSRTTASGSGTGGDGSGGGIGAAGGHGGGGVGGGQGGAGGGVGGQPGVGGSGGTAMPTCMSVQVEYQALTQNNKVCAPNQACSVINGHCGIGLGGCWYALNDNVQQADLDALAAQWQALGCMGPVCDCAPAPATASCENGECVGQ